MEEIHRKHIENNVQKLIRLTNYEKLINGCVTWQLLSNVMRNHIENIDHNDHLSTEQIEQERHKRLFLKITKRGPQAYQILKNLLISLECVEAVQLLNQPSFSNDNEFRSLHQRPNIPAERDVQPAHNVEHNQKNEEDGIGASKVKRNKPELKVYEGELIQPEYWNRNSGSKSKLIVKKTNLKEIEKRKNENKNKKVGVYPMCKEKRGVFFMVNIINFPPDEQRQGAGQDGKSLLYLFNELGFTLFAYEDITDIEFFDLLDELIKSSFTSEAECFVMALMTHGNVDQNKVERVQFCNGSIIKLSDIKARFENRNCSNLVNKPKILLFPFCRGDSSDLGHRVQTDAIGNGEQQTTHTLSDLFICYASPPGFKTHRDIKEGSWYIQNFCKNMAEHAHDSDFEDIIKMVQHDTSTWRSEFGAMQMGSYTNIGFNKKLYFNPGVVE